MSNLVNETRITTNTTRTIQSEGNWSKRFTSTEVSIPSNISMGEEMYIRACQYAKETISIYNALYSFDGALATETYNTLLKDINENLKEMEKRFKVKSYTLVIVENGAIIDAINVTTKALLDKFCIEKIGCAADSIIRNETFLVPDKYKGTKIVEQKWIDRMSDITDTIKQGS